MRHIVACAVLVALLAGLPPPARAGASTDVALGLASFAVFNQVVAPLLRPSTVVRRREVIYHQSPTVVYAVPPPVVVHAPAPVISHAPQPTVVQYPHGRYELRLEGQQYVWIWIPTIPPPPPPPPAP
jgi:hypothetical protein